MPTSSGPDPLAIVSLVVSGGTLGWTMYRDAADRPDLKIGCFIGRMIGTAGAEGTDYLVWSITNSGRRSIVVEHIGGEYLEKNKNFILVPHGRLPRALQPYETFTEYTSDFSALTNLRSLCAWDTLGRIYRAPRRKLEKIKKDLANPTAPRGALDVTPVGIY